MTCYGSDRAYECEIIVVEETEGFSSHAVRLPGVVSQGESIDEALQGIEEALQGAIEVYLSDPENRIPWSQQPVDVEGEIVCRKRIVIHA